MKKIKNILICLFIFMLCFVTISCKKKPVENKPQENQPSIDVNPNNEETSIGKKSEKINYDYILFKIINIDNNYVFNNKPINVIDVIIEQNYNDLINVETSYSKYIKELMAKEEVLKLIISDTYYKYLSVDDEFIYKLDDTIKVQNNDENVEEEIFTTINNEYTLIPIEDNKILTNSISCSFKSTVNDYDMYAILSLRYFLYSIDLDKCFVFNNFDTGKAGYMNVVLRNGDDISFFELIIKKLEIINENTEKINYSEILNATRSGGEFNINNRTYVYSLINNMGGENNEGN